ncbi:MAG: hypothetical protein Q8P56_05090, partial [Candidatus Uhrbacteria bacterium]|nr:hypothetical protein [Candidatus Uhrbacteria bacterium]
PFGVGVLLLMAYNFLRFGNVLEQGYGLQYLAYDSLRVARDYGILNIVHVPGNLFYALFAGVIPIFQDQFSHVLRFPFVRPDPWGMSLFITSPYLFLLFFFKYRERTSWLLIASIICIAVPIFLYYGIGFRQFGYRYALDFFPFLFFLFMREYMTSRAVLSRGMKVLIISSSFVNLWLFGGFLFYGNI